MSELSVKWSAQELNLLTKILDIDKKAPISGDNQRKRKPTSRVFFEILDIKPAGTKSQAAKG